MRAVSGTLMTSGSQSFGGFGRVEVIAICVDAVGGDDPPEDDQDVVAERHDRPVQDDGGGAGRGGRAASSGGDDADAGEASDALDE